MTTEEKRNYAAQLMKSRAKLNSYTQGAKRGYFFGYPDKEVGNTDQKGYSDCSAAVRAAIKAAAGIDIGSNTSAQITNRSKGLIVDQTDGIYPDESKLLPGDCLYFKGNSSHPLDVGHVEMYTGPNECYGHGSGTGPTKKDLKAYCKSRGSATKRYFMAIRWILGGEDDGARRTLQRGMSGADVTELQGMLLQLGYDLGSYGVDGDFGPATESAVKALQVNLGIAETGVVDAALWERLDGIMSGKGDSDEDVQPDAPAGNMEVRSGTWNVRTGPGTQYPIAKVVHGGDRMESVYPDGWIPVMVDGAVRWISPKAIL